MGRRPGGKQSSEHKHKLKMARQAELLAVGDDGIDSGGIGDLGMPASSAGALERRDGEREEGRPLHLISTHLLIKQRPSMRRREVSQFCLVSL